VYCIHITYSSDKNMKEPVELVNWDNIDSSTGAEKKAVADAIDWDKIEIFEDVKNKPAATKNVVLRPVWMPPLPVETPQVAEPKPESISAPPPPPPAPIPMPAHLYAAPRPTNPNACRYGAFDARNRLLTITLLQARIAIGSSVGTIMMQ